MFSDRSRSQVQHYLDLIEERKENPCTDEQQGYGHNEEKAK